MGKNDDGGGWQVVPASKSVQYKKKKEEEEKQRRMKEFEAEQAQLGFAALQSKSKEEPKEEKSHKSEADKLLEKKERKKEEKMKKKKMEKDKSKTASSPVRKTVTLASRAENIPESMLAGIAELPKKYPGRVKEQFNTVVDYLNAHFSSEVVTSLEYSKLSLRERWSMPLAAVPTSSPLVAHMHQVIDGSSDANMWNATAKDLIFEAFNQNATRPDDGTAYLGSKIALQVLISYCPAAFNINPHSVESLFLDSSGAFTDSSSRNYSWLLAQLQNGSAIEGVCSWRRVFLPTLVGNGGRNGGPIVEMGHHSAEKLSELSPSEDAKKEYFNAKGEPIAFDQLVGALHLIAPKRNKLTRLFSNLLTKYSCLFTMQSPHKYFNRLALALRNTNEVNGPILLNLLVECMVVEPNGVFTAWTHDFLPLVQETVLILEHLHKNQAELKTRINGKQFERFLERVSERCADIQKGTLVPEGKKAKLCSFTPEDVESVKGLVRRVGSLTKAVPVDAPKTKKALKKEKADARETAQKQARERAFCSTLVTVFVFAVALLLVAFLALPFLPKETVDAINTNIVDTNKLSQNSMSLLAQVQAQCKQMFKQMSS
ncbi:hypothetical protein DIPPA_04811 [Diplonema papillatum]|nr:hypothetical protein DIPPA_04811 [Diplonema papillatum]